MLRARFPFKWLLMKNDKIRMTNDWNDEARMTNAEGMTRPKNPNQNARSISSLAFWLQSFFVLRHSDFVIAVSLRFCCNAEAMRA
jgi:hypothetical protein